MGKTAPKLKWNGLHPLTVLIWPSGTACPSTGTAWVAGTGFWCVWNGVQGAERLVELKWNGLHPLTVLIGPSGTACLLDWNGMRCLAGMAWSRLEPLRMLRSNDHNFCFGPRIEVILDALES